MKFRTFLLAAALAVPLGGCFYAKIDALAALRGEDGCPFDDRVSYRAFQSGENGNEVPLGRFRFANADGRCVLREAAEVTDDGSGAAARILSSQNKRVSEGTYIGYGYEQPDEAGYVRFTIATRSGDGSVELRSDCRALDGSPKLIFDGVHQTEGGSCRADTAQEILEMARQFAKAPVVQVFRPT